MLEEGTLYRLLPNSVRKARNSYPQWTTPGCLSDLNTEKSARKPIGEENGVMSSEFGGPAPAHEEAASVSSFTLVGGGRLDWL